MTEQLHDLAELAGATILAPLLYYLPGFALLRAGERFGFGRRSGWNTSGLVAILAIAIFPALDALLIRAVGLGFTATLHLATAVVGAVYASRLRWSFEPVYFGVAALWWTLVAVSAIDVATLQGLNQSLVVVDLVKHAAVVESIVRDGLPLTDPFFFRPDRAGYYYYYYLWGAQTEWLGHGLLSGRMAYTGTLVWTAPAFVALMWRICAMGGLIRRGHARRIFTICVILFFIGGADFPAMLWRWQVTGVLEAQTDSWTEEIRFALTSMMWTPHHLAALIATWTGFLAIAQSRSESDVPRRVALVAGGGVAFASAFGMSVWIVMTAAIAMAIWAVARGRKDPAILLLFTAAGIIAATLSLWQFVDLAQGRHHDGLPIAPNIRMILWMRADFFPVLTLPLLLLLPLVYAIEFGVFAYGAALFQRARPPIPDLRTEHVRSLLLTTAIGGLLVATFLRSTILNNDLGWRAPWFAQLAGMIWTASIMQHMPRLLKPRREFVALLILGLIPNIYDMVGLRVLRPPIVNTPHHFINAHPIEDRSLRKAYLWANAHISHGYVLQHEPYRQTRMMDFGLYGAFRTAVADKEATLFGASRADVHERIQRLRPAFEKDLSASRLTAIARAEHVDVLVYSSADPIWQAIGGPPHAVRCVWRDDHACLAPVDRIGGK